MVQNDKDLKVGDLVYFQKESDNKLISKWIIGIIDQVIRSKNGRVQRVIVRYQNHNEEGPRFTESWLKSIFDIDQYVLQDDLTEFLKRLNSHDTGNTEEPFNSVSQVMYSVTRNNIPCLNSSFISGTWRTPPVSDPPNSEYVVMMTKQILNTCPDYMRMNDQVNGIEEDYFIAS